ncbi:TWiK family of potassium channels protein 7 [Portunus trituberculatus]|uniref:TWiK family of potassium channels protein 7 n=1 Tax=Portunus trituberculatus TaxID=210409 RepID=A0A5B7EAF2_PORTR|nr:TWiK family of potassium channels protein 7 [Portunus trituberculatus]
MFLVLALYTALGALLFIAIEGPHENEEKHDIESERKLLLERLWDHQTLNNDLNFTRWEEIATDFLKRYDKQLYHSWSVGISPDTDDRIWTFWKAMFFCSTITTTIARGGVRRQDRQANRQVECRAVPGALTRTTCRHLSCRSPRKCSRVICWRTAGGASEGEEEK